MNRISTRFLQAMVVLIGIGALAFLLWEPHIEGRNVHATNFEIYFKDPFLMYAYIGSIPFFIILFQTHKLLGHIQNNQISSPKTAQTLQTIRRSAQVLLGFVLVGELYIMLHKSDDRAGGVALGIVVILVSSVIIAAASIFERVLSDSSERKSDSL